MEKFVETGVALFIILKGLLPFMILKVKKLYVSGKSYISKFYQIV